MLKVCPTFGFKVDLVKAKDRLLDITTQLTCGVVNGRRTRVRPVIRPPWAQKKPESTSKLSPAEDTAAPEDGTKPNSALSREKLKELRNQQGWPHFKDVFMLSSVDKEDVETLKVISLWERWNGCEVFRSSSKIPLNNKVNSGKAYPSLEEIKTMLKGI